MQRRVVNMKVLPGEPTNGSGRLCIHLFVIDSKGSFIEPAVQQEMKTIGRDGQENIMKGQLRPKPMRGRIACNKKLIPHKHKKTDKVINLTLRTDDPRATTCPKCKNTPEYKEMMTKLEQT